MTAVRLLASRFCGFSMVGGASTLASVALLYLMNEVFGWYPYCSYVTAYVITVVFSYAANAMWVYQQPLRIVALIKFVITYLSGMLVGVLLLMLLRNVFRSVNDTLLSCAVIPLTVVWNFVFVNRILGQKTVKQRKI